MYSIIEYISDVRRYNYLPYYFAKFHRTTERPCWKISDKIKFAEHFKSPFLVKTLNFSL